MSVLPATGRLAPTLRPYRRAWVGRDLLAGVAAGCVVIPQAMGYATIAGLPVAFGLYTCMLPMVVYALLGGSHTRSAGARWSVPTPWRVGPLRGWGNLRSRDAR
ncbi:hypothetical protein BN12_130028 [Nostocoides japonicum T1-X7]|uniref:SLC26A/SulP transporter domain-containing protein n=1 Tax=Nostocoides japonicum T1-X7 TaxID=1194083 RepID=A0A077LWV4_9MICO|nr:SulP family inorganic anion transporter [Tetrasphaera japonica]CCH76489.1 hypothetical protein BN12_130028 [Tetrasphaera japonica T1-X7]